MKNMNKMTQLHSNKGYTMVELVVTLAILGTLLGTAMPMYSRITEQTQADRNRTNMNVIRETFFHYFYRTHMAGDPHFPVTPDNTGFLMDDTWAGTAIASGAVSGITPNDLFSDSQVPKNSNGNPFSYRTYNTTLSSGEVRYTIILEDTDPESPSYQESFTHSI
jgi:prepilin-type N-terminal cleavage/methylation domain-containing protein